MAEASDGDLDWILERKGGEMEDGMMSLIFRRTNGKQKGKTDEENQLSYHLFVHRIDRRDGELAQRDL